MNDLDEFFRSVEHFYPDSHELTTSRLLAMKQFHELRADKIRLEARHAFRWLPKARAIREMRRSNLTVEQPRLL
jgi:hypothetical protein